VEYLWLSLRHAFIFYFFIIYTLSGSTSVAFAAKSSRFIHLETNAVQRSCKSNIFVMTHAHRMTLAPILRDWALEQNYY